MSPLFILQTLCFTFALSAYTGSESNTASSPGEPFPTNATPGSAEAARFYLPCASIEEITARGGALPHGSPQVVDGPSGKAFRFDGKTFATFPEADSLDVQETSIQLCFRPQFEQHPGYNPCLVAKRASGDHRQTRWSIHLLGDHSGIALWNGAQVATFRSAAGNLEKGRWYFLAVVAGKDRTMVYLNGVPCLSEDTTWRLNLAEVKRPLNIASSQPDGAELFQGDICQLAIFEGTLDQKTVEAHADALGFHQERIALRGRYEEVLRERKAREARLAELREKRRRELMEDPALFARGEPTVYQGEHLEAIDLPVGGIGVGAIHMNGQAERHAWQIFGNVAYRPLPHSFFAIAVDDSKKRVVRALQTVGVDDLPPMKSVSLKAKFPFAEYTFADSNLNAVVQLTAFNPLIPLNARDSAIPCCIYRVTVSNPTDSPLRATVLATQLNPIGYQGDQVLKSTKYPGFRDNVSLSGRDANAAWLHLVRRGDPQAGDMVLAVMDTQATIIPHWEKPGDWRSLFDQVEEAQGSTKAEAGPAAPGTTLVGAVLGTVEVLPSQSRSVTFVLTWYVPGQPAGSGAWSCQGRRYEAWWPNAEGVAREVLARLPELETSSRLYVDTLYESNLPHWLLDRISSQVAILRSPTVFWCRDGYFGGWEGCNIDSGCCHGNCNHVWHYAQAHARLFPEIARQMRAQEFRFQKPDGAIPHRQPDSFPAFDGQCGAVLNSYREHLMSRDGSWLESHWSSIQAAMDYVINRWDRDGDGVLSGPQWNTLDGELGGSSSWLGSLYLAALAAAEEMAILQDDPESAARYRKIREFGSKNQDETLFNGRYYIQIPDPTPHQDYGQGCAIDQLLGQWWAHQLDLGWLYPADHARSALQNLFLLNFRGRMEGLPQQPRKFVADDDAGMQMFVWPEGTTPPASCILYASEVMTGFEYASAAAMIQAGLLKEGLTTVRAIAIRYDGRKRTGLTGAAWGYSGNPFGDDECGKFYARAMSVWSILLACQGLIVDGPGHRLGFIPVWQPENHISFFTAAEGWGLLRQNREGRSQTNSVEIRHGRLVLQRFETALPPGITPSQVICQIGGQPVELDWTEENGRVLCRFSKPLTIAESEKLDVTFTW